jgi:hypothetical protein
VISQSPTADAERPIRQVVRKMAQAVRFGLILGKGQDERRLFDYDRWRGLVTVFLQKTVST